MERALASVERRAEGTAQLTAPVRILKVGPQARCGTRRRIARPAGGACGFEDAPAVVREIVREDWITGIVK